MEELFHAKKTIGVNPNKQSCHVYIHTAGITGVGNPHSCRNIFRIELCDNLSDSDLSYTFKLFAYNALSSLASFWSSPSHENKQTDKRQILSIQFYYSPYHIDVT